MSSCRSWNEPLSARAPDLDLRRNPFVFAAPFRRQPRVPVRLLAAVAVVAIVAAACSGGGSSSSSAPTAAAPSTAASSGAPGSGSVASPAASGLVPLTVGLGYIASVQFAQFYYAQQQGYYKAAGLDVT